MPFNIIYTPTVQGSAIDAQVKLINPPVGSAMMIAALKLIYADLITGVTSAYTTAAATLVVMFPPASPAPAVVAPAPLLLTTLAPLDIPGGTAIDAKAKLAGAVPPTAGLLTWTAFFTQVYTDFSTQFASALATAFSSFSIIAQPLPVPGVGLLAPSRVTLIPFTPADFASIQAQLLATVPASAAILDAGAKAAGSTLGAAAGAVIWDLVIKQIAIDLNLAFLQLLPLVIALMPTKAILGPTSTPPGLAAPVPPAGPTPLPPTPAIAF